MNYILGLVIFTIGWMLLSLGIYIFPYLFFHWHYNLPGFVFEWRHLLLDIYQWNESWVGFGLFILFFIPGLISIGLIRHMIWNQAQAQAQDQDQDQDQNNLEEKSRLSYKLTLQILLFIIIIFVMLRIIQWLISK